MPVYMQFSEFMQQFISLKSIHFWSVAFSVTFTNSMKTLGPSDSSMEWQSSYSFAFKWVNNVNLGENNLLIPSELSGCWKSVFCTWSPTAMYFPVIKPTVSRFLNEEGNRTMSFEIGLLGKCFRWYLCRQICRSFPSVYLCRFYLLWKVNLLG